eukprot:289967_1
MSQEWNEIMAWLQSLTYGDYASKFKNGGYDLWEIMYDLSVNDLRDIGIKPGHAKRIKKQLALHKDSRAAQPSIHTKPETDKDTKLKSASSSSIALPNKMANATKPHPPHETKSIETQQQQQQKQMAHAQHLQQLQIEERKRKIRERFQQNALFAGGIKNKLFETMTRVLNGLQQELIQYNGKFAEPINEMNQRIVALQKLDVHNLDGIWDSNDGLFEPMMRNVKDIKKFNNSMWSKINEFHNLAESQIKQSMKQLQQQINIINQMKTQYLLKQHHINALKRQFVQQQHAQQQQYKQPPMNTIVVNSNNTNNGAVGTNTPNKDQSAKAMVSNVKFSNLSNQFNYAPLNNILPQLTTANVSHHPNSSSSVDVSSAISLPNSIGNGDVNAKDFKMKEKSNAIKPNNGPSSNTKKNDVDSSKLKNASKEMDKRKKRKQKTTGRVTVGRKPAYTSGELQMMQNYDKKKQTVADIIELQRNMQSIYGIPRSAYGIAQKMYRMGVLSATLPKKLQALQDKPDADKIKIGDGIMSVRKPRGKPRKVTTVQVQTVPNSRSSSPSDSYYSSNDDEDGSTSSSDSDDVSSDSSDSEHPQRNTRNTNDFEDVAMTQSADNLVSSATSNGTSGSMSAASSLLYKMDYQHREDALVPQRKPPSTNLRRYTQDEVNYIRRLVTKDPNGEAKTLFYKFRSKFTFWKDDTESYTKFYQKKWRICKEKESNTPYAVQNNLKRKRSVSLGLPMDNALQTNNNQPPLKKIKVNGTNHTDQGNNMLPPLIGNSPKREQNETVSFDASAMPKLPFVLSNDGTRDANDLNKPLPTIGNQNETQTETQGKKDETHDIKKEIMPPPLPPPPAHMQAQNSIY